MADWEDDVREGAERTLWVTSYADYVDELREHGQSRANIREMGFVYAGGGEDWNDIVPPAYPGGPWLALRDHGEALLEEYRRKNDADIDDILKQAARADGLDEGDITTEYAESFGHYLAMMALGHGVSWFDDHSRFPLVIPDMECDYDGESLSCDSEVRRMNMSAAARHSLPGGDFAVPELEGLPIDTAGRTRAAMARFNQFHFENRAQAKSAFRRIVRRARHFDIDDRGFRHTYRSYA